MKELNNIQKQVLNLFSKSSLKDDFYWSGGTLLSVVYLHHRQSKDIDFFSDNPIDYDKIMKFINELKDKFHFSTVETKKIHNRWEFLMRNKENIRLEFVHYEHTKLKERKRRKGILIDSLEDIAANKLVAFFDRNDPKDLFDLYFLLTKKYKIEKLLDLAEKKFGVRFSKFSVFSETFKAMDNLNNLKPLLLVKSQKEEDELIKKIKDYFAKQSDSLLSGFFK